MTAVAADGRIDLRRATLADLRAIDFRSPARGYWADEAAIHDRLVAAWAGLDDDAWRLPGAAPSDAGGPDWSLLDHVGHVVDWWELATEYVARVLDGGPWPSDDDFDADGGFDRLNEVRRARFADIEPAALRARGLAAHEAVLAVTRQLPVATIRGDAAWGWVHQVLHGHAIDHLAVVEPWADALRARQVRNDPFGPDPQPTRANLAEAKDRFWRAEATVLGAFRETMAAVPDAAWASAMQGDWTFADHVAHLAGWFDEGAAALEMHGPDEPWAEVPPEGIDAFNDRQVQAARGTSPADLRARFDAGHARLRAAAAAMTDEEWLDPEGFSWAYEDLQGHVRGHHAMIGPWAARVGWPPAEPAGAHPAGHTTEGRS